MDGKFLALPSPSRSELKADLAVVVSDNNKHADNRKTRACISFSEDMPKSVGCASCGLGLTIDEPPRKVVT